MAKIASKIDIRSPEFADNRAAMQALVDDLRATLQRNAVGGSEAARAKHTKAGKLLARERINALLDPGSPFLELSALAAQGVYGEELPGAGLITGIGRISGRECMVVANDPTVKGGTYYPLTVKKHLRAQEIAGDNALPCIYLVESGGAFLPKQDEVFPDREHFGRIFFNQARLSAQGIAQIAVVHGSCTAGGAYVPAMSDHAIIVRNQGRVFLGGPPLVRAATGEEIDAESLGGADVHCRKSGVTDYYAENDTHALAFARRAVARLRPAALRPCGRPPASGAASRYDPAELYGIIPPNSRKPYDVREVIARLVDGAWFDEFKALYGTTLVCGFADIHGTTVGIIANNGILFSESSLKGAHFIELCCREGIPLVFLQNISGFMVGPGRGSRRHRQRWRETGDGRGLCGGAEVHRGHRRQFRRRQLRHVRPRLQPALLVSVAERAHLGDGRRTGGQRVGDHPARGAGARRRNLERRGRRKNQGADPRAVRTQGHPYYASARLWDDGVIDPLDTRRVLGLALALTRAQEPAADTLRRVSDVRRDHDPTPADRQSRRNRLPHRPHRPALGGDHASRCIRMRIAMRGTCAAPTRPIILGAAPAADSYLNIAARSSRSPSASAPMPCIPVMDFCRRMPHSRRPAAMRD